MTLPDRLRAHYQECDTCNRDLLLAADHIETLEQQDQFHRAHIEQQAEIIARYAKALREIADDVDEEHMQAIARAALNEESLPHDVEQHETKGKTATNGDREQD